MAYLIKEPDILYRHIGTVKYMEFVASLTNTRDGKYNFYQSVNLQILIFTQEVKK